MITIERIAYHLPPRIETNDALQRANPDWDVEKLADKTGVFTRHIARDCETAFDLASAACDKLLAADAALRESIDGIIFCTQSPDYVMPSNAFLLHRHLNLRESVLAFDFNLACSGFVYGLAIAQGFIATALAKNILLVTADTYSKYIHPRDRSARLLFGDGAAACHITKSRSVGMIDVSLASSGKDYECFYIPAGGCRTPKSAATAADEVDAGGNMHTAETIHMNGFGVWKFIASAVPKQIIDILSRNGHSTSTIDLYIFHQASKLTVNSLVKALKLDPGKVFNNIDRVGNLVSASIPVALKDAESAGRLKRGDLVLLSGFGAGLSWGTAILRY